MKINIGTTKKNIVGYKINKKFKDLTVQDIYDIVKIEFGNTEKISVIGWCKTKDSKK